MLGLGYLTTFFLPIFIEGITLYTEYLVPGSGRVLDVDVYEYQNDIYVPCTRRRTLISILEHKSKQRHLGIASVGKMLRVTYTTIIDIPYSYSRIPTYLGIANRDTPTRQVFLHTYLVYICRYTFYSSIRVSSASCIVVVVDY